jgi:regulator of replication initiation timing
MYSSEYVNELIAELEKEKKLSWELLDELTKERIENSKLKSMLDEDNNKLIKETERGDNLSDLVQKLQNEIKRLKHN